MRENWGKSFKTGKNTADPTLGRPPGRLGLNREQLGFSRSTGQSTGLRQKKFFVTGFIG